MVNLTKKKKHGRIVYQMIHYGGNLKQEEIISKIKKHILFANSDENKIISLIKTKDTEIKAFKQGDEIFSQKNKDRKLGLMLIGEASVYSTDANHPVLLRSMFEGDAFGISNLFNENEEFVSTIVAKKQSSVILFSSQTIKQLLDESAEFRTAYIKFLSERICFLNKKISCFTAGTPERRLAVFLCSKSGEQSFSFTLNAKALSDMLNVGRASLYRAFDKLISDGFITKEAKTITVLDRKALEETYTE